MVQLVNVKNFPKYVIQLPDQVQKYQSNYKIEAKQCFEICIVLREGTQLTQ